MYDEIIAGLLNLATEMPEREREWVDAAIAALRQAQRQRDVLALIANGWEPAAAIAGKALTLAEEAADGKADG